MTSTGGTFMKTGPATLTLAGTNSGFAAQTFVNWGGLVYASSNALPGTAGSINIATNGALVGFDFTAANGLQLALGRVNGSSSGTVAVTTGSAGEVFDFNAANLTNALLGALGQPDVHGLAGSVRRADTGTKPPGRRRGADLQPAINRRRERGHRRRGRLPRHRDLRRRPTATPGGTTLASGTLRIAGDSSPGAVPASGITNVTFAGGTLQLGGAGIVFPSNRIWIVNATSTLDDAGYGLTLSNSIAGAGHADQGGLGHHDMAGHQHGQHAAGRRGNFILATASSNGSFNVGGGVTGATLRVNAQTIASGSLSVGMATGDRSVLTIASNLTLGVNLNIGNAAGAAAAVYQSNGVVTVANFGGPARRRAGTATTASWAAPTRRTRIWKSAPTARACGTW